MLLLLESLPFGNAGACVAVFRDPGTPKVEVVGVFTVHCEYKRRRVIVDEVVFKGQTEDTVPNVSGKLSVYVG